jgi:LysR family transcriptional regulator, glycine cleavage system transcriptional activator
VLSAERDSDAAVSAFRDWMLHAAAEVPSTPPSA